jgi:hypothetical protein
MMKHASEDDEQLRPTNSSEGAPVGTPRRHAVSPAWRSFAIAIAACVFGILAGVAFHAPRPPPPQPIRPGEGGGHHMHQHFVTEYDLVTIRYETPMAFETDVRGLGVTDEEYKACKSSILQDPKRKICTKAGTKCYMKKLKYEKDSNGDMQPKYVKQGATDVDCPAGHGWLQPTPDDSWQYNGWPDYCRKQPEGSRRIRRSSNTAINICYGEITCEEESSQWNTQVARGGPRGQCEFLIDWAVPDRYNYNDRFWCATDAPSWYGGPIPSNLTYPSSSATSTAPYEGKFCLQKAALKALSRRGWELIQPSEAFEPHGYYGYTNAWLRDIYASKTFKVIKRTLAM